MNKNALLDSVELAELLSQGLKVLALDLSDIQQQKLVNYLKVLTKWNGVYNLTAIREPQRMVTHHLLDSLAILPHLPPVDDFSLLDVGTGAGLPAVPLAIARPDWQIQALDSSQKKTAFVQQAGSELALTNLQVVNCRVENYQSLFDGIISRAFADLADFTMQTQHLLKPAGKWYAMKGLYPQEEIANLIQTGPEWVVETVHSVTVPFLEATRHLVVISAHRPNN